MIFFSIAPWAIVILLLIIAVFAGLKSKWWPLVLLIIILFVYKSCEQYEEDWGENGRFVSKTEENVGSYGNSNYNSISSETSAYKYQPSAESKRQGNEISENGYYPMKCIDMKRPDCYPPAPRTNKTWKEGYEAGAEAGAKDYLAGTPYASYDIEGYYRRQKGSTWRHGYWVGYSESYPGLKRLIEEEVMEMYKKSKYYNP